MSIMHFDAMTAVGETVELSLRPVNASDLDSFSATAGFEFRADGTSWKRIGGGKQQVNTDTDWIFPRTSFNSADYEIRWHETSRQQETGGGILSQANSTGWNEDTFLPLDTTRWVEYTETKSFFGPESPAQEINDGWFVVLVMEIRNIAVPSKNLLTSSIDAEAVAEIGVFYTISLNSF